MSGARAAWRGLRERVRRSEQLPEGFELTDEDRRYLTTLHDDTVPLPPGASRELRADSSRLAELRDRYAAAGIPALSEPSRWSEDAVDSFLDLSYFRGETLITWHYRELPRITRLKFFILARYVQGVDSLGLLERLEEDGAFGCWSFTYPGIGRVSRDLLESVNEISFLERELGLSRRTGLNVLDIGAGYGRLAHRMAAALPGLGDYCCVDAVAESTFVSEYYLRHRGCSPPTRVIGLDEVGSLPGPGHFELAVNIHSFSECTHAAVSWWVGELARLGVPNLLVVPNEPDDLLTLERDGSRRDFQPLLEREGYELRRHEPVIADAAVRELLELDDRFHLFALRAQR